MTKSVALGLVILAAILCLTTSDPVDEYSNVRHLGHDARDGYNHFRVCEGQTAHFECFNHKKLHLGGCWYGAPVGDSGFGVCGCHSNCNLVVGECVGYIVSQCEGKDQCDVSITNEIMGGDPCPVEPKFGAIALQCNA
eukprot:UN01453